MSMEMQPGLSSRIILIIFLQTLILLLLPVAALNAQSHTSEKHLPQACHQRDCLSLTTYNTYWLGSEKRHIKGLRKAETIKEIARFLTQTNSDLILLQEVNASKTSHGKENYSTASFHTLASELQKSGYSLFAGESGYTQQLAIAFKKNRIKEVNIFELELDNSFYIDSKCKSRNLRRPLAAEFRLDKMDFKLINLHLKSSYRNHSCAQKIRALQITQLANYFRVHRHNKPSNAFIFGGDFNTAPDSAELLSLQLQGFSPAIPTNHDGAAVFSYKKGKRKSLIDFFIFENRLKPHWTGETIIHTPDKLKISEKKYLDSYSDHMAVTTWFVLDKLTESTLTLDKD